MEVNDKNVQNLLNRLRKKINNLRPVMNEIGEILHDSIMENFEQEGRPKWKELSPVTLAIRRKYGWTGKILNIHGASGLVGSINYRADKDSVRIGTAKKYARALHFGVDERNLPARPFIEAKEHDITLIKLKITEYLMKEYK